MTAVAPRTSEAPAAPPPLRVRRLGVVPYAESLAAQEAALTACIGGTGPELILLLEHPPVYTLGRGADAADLRGADERLGVPVFRVGRGGGVTFHGPGQLVAYPIVRLRANGRDVHGYVRTLEATLIDTCAHFGVVAHAPAGQTGIFVGERKLASIGIGVRRGVAYHGIALNVSTDLTYFGQVVPCRSVGLEVVNLAVLLDRTPTPAEVGDVFAERLSRRLGFDGVDTEGRAWP